MTNANHTGGETPAGISAGGTLLAPVGASERLDVMDILRGIALVGILLMNVEWFNRPMEDLGVFDKTLTGLDHAAGWLVRCLVEGKFYKIFALLFGMGFAVMLIRAQEAGRPFVAWFTRRMVALFVIGILHFVFLFPGDIVHDYAIGGMLVLGWVLLFRTRRLARFNRPDAFLKIALVLLLVPFIATTVAGFVYGTTHDPSDLEKTWIEEQQVAAMVAERIAKAAEEPLATETDDEEGAEDDTNATEPTEAPEDTDAAGDAEPDDAAEPAVEDEEEVDEIEEKVTEKVEDRLEREQHKKDEIAAYTESSYWEATLYRLQILPRLLKFSPVFAIVLLLPVFLVGYWFVASGTLARHHENRRLFKWMAIIGTTFGLLLNVGGLTLLQHPVSKIAGTVAGAGGVTFMLGQFLLSAGYVGLIVLASDSARCRRWLEPFAPLGRMALTNYIMQSLILVLIFHAYGAGMFGRISRSPQMLIVAAIIAFQLIVSSWWLKRFRFGPLEWLWRSVTYKSWQPMRIAA